MSASRTHTDAGVNTKADTKANTKADAHAKLSLLVNGESQRLAAPCSVADLLVHLELGGKRVAVAVNRNVVVRSSYAEAELAEGDHIEILEAVGGG